MRGWVSVFLILLWSLNIVSHFTVYWWIHAESTHEHNLLRTYFFFLFLPDHLSLNFIFLTSLIRICTSSGTDCHTRTTSSTHKHMFKATLEAFTGRTWQCRHQEMSDTNPSRPSVKQNPTSKNILKDIPPQHSYNLPITTENLLGGLLLHFSSVLTQTVRNVSNVQQVGSYFSMGC